MKHILPKGFNIHFMVESGRNRVYFLAGGLG